jgi:hypothetical protein
MSDEKSTTLDCWALVELFGHQKIAGRVTEQSIAGAAMLRVDVPETPRQTAYTRYFGHGAIYSINPTTEEIARSMAGQCSSEPVQRYQLPAPEKEQSNGPHDWDDDDDDTPELQTNLRGDDPNP